MLKWAIPIACLTALLVWYVSLPEAPVALIPRSVLFGSPVRAVPKLAPDGRQIAYLAPDEKGVLNIWVAPLDDLSRASQVTQDKKRGIRNYFWQADGQHLAYLQDSDGDENWHLYQINVQTLTTRDLTPFAGSRARIVGYEPDKPDQMLIALNLRDKSLFDVFRLNLQTGALERDTENRHNFFNFLADHTLHVRVAERFSKDGGQEIFARDSTNSPWRPLISWGPEETIGTALAFAPDNESIYVLSSLGSDTLRLLEVELSTGKRTELLSDAQYDLEGIVTHPKTHQLQAAAIDREKSEYIPLNPEFQADLAFLQRAVGAHFDIGSRTPDDQKWIVALNTDAKPLEFHLYDRTKQITTRLFTTRPELEKYRLSEMLPISFQARDGMTIHGYLTLPTGKKPKNLPAVVLVHGGPWLRDSWGLDLQVQWLANRGYAVLQVNYRGSLGYGKAYLNAGKKEWGGKMQDDLIDAKNWLVKQGYANPNKVAIYGGSYGGYATLAALAFTPEQFCCGVDLVGVSNISTFLQTQPAYWGPAKALFDQRVGDLEADAELLHQRSPLFHARNIQRPLLIVQGANDPRVKQSESDQIVEALRANHRPVEYLLFPDEGHGLARPENRLKFYSIAEHFLAQHLGGREEQNVKDQS